MKIKKLILAPDEGGASGGGQGNQSDGSGISQTAQQLFGGEEQSTSREGGDGGTGGSGTSGAGGSGKSGAGAGGGGTAVTATPPATAISIEAGTTLAEEVRRGMHTA